MRTETVTRLRATMIRNPYSDEDDGLSWVTPDELEITTLAPAEPRPSTEPVQDARNAVTTGFTLYLPVDADVTAADRMTVRNITYDVLGDPSVWAGAGIVVQVGRTDG